MHLGDRIRRLRRQRQWTQTELAERALVSLRTIVRIEAGETRPNRSTLRLIAQALDTTEYDLTNGEAA